MGSPIEDALVNALLNNTGDDIMIEYEGQMYGAEGGGFYVAMDRDVRLLTYRVDILLRPDMGGEFRLAIECDGHENHDRTKQQAAYDRARDRELLREKVITIRFTGSEIYHDAARCAEETWKCLRVLFDIEGENMSSYHRGADFGERYALERLDKRIDITESLGG